MRNRHAHVVISRHSQQPSVTKSNIKSINHTTINLNLIVQINQSSIRPFVHTLNRPPSLVHLLCHTKPYRATIPSYVVPYNHSATPLHCRLCFTLHSTSHHILPSSSFLFAFLVLCFSLLLLAFLLLVLVCLSFVALNDPAYDKAVGITGPQKLMNMSQVKYTVH